MSQVFQIGKAAKSTGLTIDTIRFYQKQGLLKPQARSSSGYRLFSNEDVARLQFIANAQQLGFSLAEIKELVALRTENGTACPEVRDLLSRKLSSLRMKIRALQKLERELTGELKTCDQSLHLDWKKQGCPVLDKIQRAAGGRTR